MKISLIHTNVYNVPQDFILMKHKSTATRRQKDANTTQVIEKPAKYAQQSSSSWTTSAFRIVGRFVQKLPLDNW